MTPTTRYDPGTMVSRIIQGVLVVVAFLACSCASKPPPNWATGGAGLAVGLARWTRSDATVELRPDGKVLIDGDAVLGIDRAGRVFETDGEAVAVLDADGNLVGRDAAHMGMVGSQTASFPGDRTAWVGLGPRGEVIRFGSEGERSQDGYWQGCEGAMATTCMLVTHVILLREWQRRPRVGVGIGVGFGVPIR